MVKVRIEPLVAYYPPVIRISSQNIKYRTIIKL
nr:MAG TPA: hypothetical protein [Caudoviricetes sp.]DAL71725.1 MAG TPA: hypothetical protein [Caudoviricetes sp.]DAN19568.1 MAG TPA: hypothetical protein [Caudoviricetes sp.]DAV37969.1 MAG TPA: hypothetical protein [Caudoviricetes sp.]